MQVYVYLVLLLLMIILSIEAIHKSFKKAPPKIKIFTLIIMVMICLRYIALTLMFILQNLNYMYITKYALVLNFVYIPSLTILCLYVFLRKDGLNFSYVFLVLLIFSAIYIAITVLVPVSFRISNIFGYVMEYAFEGWIDLALILIVSILIFISIVSYGGKNSINEGMILIIISLTVVAVEQILKLKGVEIAYNNIAGELMLISTLNYALYRFKGVKPI